MLPPQGDTTLTDHHQYSSFILARKISADSLSYLFRLNTVTGEDGGLEESQNPLMTDHLRNFFIEEKRTRMAKILVGLMISY